MAYLEDVIKRCGLSNVDYTTRDRSGNPRWVLSESIGSLGRFTEKDLQALLDACAKDLAEDGMRNPGLPSMRAIAISDAMEKIKHALGAK